jgi:regulator of protease activity HflC (stomatin/prohibitin superfamily)
MALTVIGGRIAYSENPKGYGKLVSGLAVVVGVVFILILTVFRSFHTVDNGHIGIVKQFGNLVNTTGSGLVTTAPWQSLAEVSVRNELRVYDMGESNSAVSADSQPVFLTVQVNYSLVRAKAVPLYKKTGGDYVNRILDPAVFQFTKEVTAEYKATDFAANREQIRIKIEERLNANVKPQGILINSVSLKNVNFTADLKRAIEQTVEANQQAKREQARVTIVQAQAQQKVAQAKGDAQATLTNARANAEAQRLQNHTLTKLLVQKEAIDKLNPNVQVIVCPSHTSCVPQAVLSTATGK